jgi:predicted TIM-barrel fold metal-dependent hydrolase
MILDAHIHLFDPTRSQGIPWPGKTALPATSARLREVAEPHGVVGAIHVEASPWLEDNDWVLKTIENDPFMLGMVGNLDPLDAQFGKRLERYSKHKKFLGLRYGNLWGKDLAKDVEQPRFLDAMLELARAGLTLDSANPTNELLAGLLRLSDAVPDLRIVIDHLPSLATPDLSTLRALAKRAVFVKVSMFPKGAEAQAPERMALALEVFGPERVLFGSDWPNSAGNWRTYEQAVKLVQPFFTVKAPGYFAANARAAYRLGSRV